MKLASADTNPAIFPLNSTPQIGAGKMSMEKIEEAAKDFEAMFVSEMMKPMFEGLKPNSLFGGGKTEEVFRGMLIDEYGKDIAARGGLGIADQVKEQLIRAQQGQDDAKLAQNMQGTLADTKAATMQTGENNVQ